MRTLDDLKKCATAAELCLIDAIVEATKEEAADAVFRKAVSFLNGSPPPSREDMRFDPDRAKQWIGHLTDALRKP